MREWIVSPGEEGRLDRFLLSHLPWLTTGRLHKYVRENKIKVDGRKLPLSAAVSSGSAVRLYLPDSALEPPVQAVYEDSEILIADKPAGLLTLDETGHAADTLELRVRRRLPQARACHRLDAGTQGLVLFAKTEDVRREMEALIRARSIVKEYLCVTVGHPSPACGEIRGYLRKDACRSLVRMLPSPAPGAKISVTRYETLASAGPHSLLRAELVTGRTHQIRVHMAAIGCPLLGDDKYGSHTANRAARMKHQALCAWRLTFPKAPGHPWSGLVATAQEPWFAEKLRQGKALESLLPASPFKQECETGR